MPDKFVILKLNEERSEYTLTKQMPKNMRDEFSKKIGSEFDKSQGTKSKEIIRGLGRELEKIYLPNLIGVSTDNPDFAKRALDFWADYTITPTAKGLKLNIGMEDATVVDKSGESKTIQVPINIDDYMQWKFALQSSKVASKSEDIENPGWFDFILEDLTESRQKEVDKFTAKNDALIAYAKISVKFQDNVDKVDWMIELTKEKRTTFNPNMEEIEKKILLNKLAEERPDTFLELISDTDLENKAFLSKALTNEVITKEGNEYFYMNENMGSEERGALAWIKKPEKSGSVAAIKAKLAEKVKNKRTINT